MDDAKKLTRAIRAKCLDCSGGDSAEVALCHITDCPLYYYRMEMRASLLEPAPEDGDAGKNADNKAGNAGQGQHSLI